jgi:hypothetical protein
VTPRTLRKKNSQRGPGYGKVLMMRYTNPAQPMMARMIAAGNVDFAEGDFMDF